MCPEKAHFWRYLDLYGIQAFASLHVACSDASIVICRSRETLADRMEVFLEMECDPVSTRKPTRTGWKGKMLQLKVVEVVKNLSFSLCLFFLRSEISTT